MDDKIVARLRDICLALPEASERETWDAPTFRVRSKIFAILHLVDGRPSVWMKSNVEERDARIAHDPARYFSPPYLGGRGWLGGRLDASVDWDELADPITDSFVRIAPKRLSALLAEHDYPTGEASGGSGVSSANGGS